MSTSPRSGDNEDTPDHAFDLHDELPVGSPEMSPDPGPTQIVRASRLHSFHPLSEPADISRTRDHFDMVAGTRSSGELHDRVVAIVGGGAIGVWVAYQAWSAGATVVVYDDQLTRTYEAAAGWVYAYHASDPEATPLAMKATALWELYSAWLPEGAVTKTTMTVQRTGRTSPFPKETPTLPGYAKLRKRDLKDVSHLGFKFKEGFTADTLVAPAVLWHPVMRRCLIEHGVSFEFKTISSAEQMAKLEGDVLVDAAGVRSAQLFDVEHQLMPVRGTVLRLAHDGKFSGVYSYDLNDGTSKDPYAISLESAGVIVVGGEFKPLSWPQAMDWIRCGCPPEMEVADEILARIFDYHPELRGLPVVDVVTGLRPVRDRMMKMVDATRPRVIHASGFGGFGLTVAPAVAFWVVEQAIEQLRRGWENCE